MPYQTIPLARKLGLRAVLAASLVLACAAGIPRPVHADGGRRYSHEVRGPARHHHYRDARHHHSHLYPRPGYRVAALPLHPHRLIHRGTPFFFSGGVWYRPVRHAYVVVRPPVGAFVPALPLVHTRLWIGNSPYYYANEVYYVPGRHGYSVVARPAGMLIGDRY